MNDPVAPLPRPRVAAAVAAAIALLAYGLHALLRDVPHLPGASILALVGGLLAANLRRPPPGLRAGARPVVQQAIGPSIVLIGAGLDLAVLGDGRVGRAGLLAVAAAMAVAFGASLLAARWAGLSRRTGILLGMGTAVCGNSAIVAAAPVVGAEEEEIVLTLGAINLLGVLAMFAVPPLGLLAGLDAAAAGILSGTTIHAVPQAVAAGEALGPEPLVLATLFKLARVAMLAPLVVLLALLAGRGAGPRPGLRQLLGKVPWFVWGFVLAALMRTTGALDATVDAPGLAAAPLGDLLRAAGKFLLAIALAAIGLQIELRSFLRVGPRVLLAGLAAAAAMTASALLLQGGLG